MSSKASPKRQKGRLASKDDYPASAPAAAPTSGQHHRRRHLSHPQRHSLPLHPHRGPHHHELIKDTEENVAAQTDTVFRSFVYEMYVNDVTSQQTDDDDLPSLPEVRRIREQPVTPLAEIGRQLAAVGDDINDRYRPQFNRMIRSLNITPDTAYDLFAQVARKLFDDGVISWGRVVTLLCFGYRMAMVIIRRGLVTFLSTVVRFIVRFILIEKIAKWIAEQGGWRAVLTYIPESIGWTTIGLIVTLSAISVITAICLSRVHTSQ